MIEPRLVRMSDDHVGSRETQQDGAEGGTTLAEQQQRTYQRLARSKAKNTNYLDSRAREQGFQAEKPIGDQRKPHSTCVRVKENNNKIAR